MLKNKMISAIITLMLGIFIIPLFINYTYSISHGIYGTAFTAPAMPIAVIVSILIETYSKNKHVLITYLKHLVATFIFTLLYSLYFKATFSLIFSIGSIYITIFFIIDCLIKLRK